MVNLLGLPPHGGVFRFVFTVKHDIAVAVDDGQLQDFINPGIQSGGFGIEHNTWYRRNRRWLSMSQVRLQLAFQIGFVLIEVRVVFLPCKSAQFPPNESTESLIGGDTSRSDFKDDIPLACLYAHMWLSATRLGHGYDGTTGVFPPADRPPYAGGLPDGDIERRLSIYPIQTFLAFPSAHGFTSFSRANRREATRPTGRTRRPGRRCRADAGRAHGGTRRIA